MAFLNDDDYEHIPEDDGEAFAVLESISRKRLLDQERDGSNDLYYEEVMGYMNEVSALAEQFNIPDISYETQPQNFNVEFGNFTRKVEYRTAQIRIQRARRNQKNSVGISGPGRERIQHHLERLKAEIEAADIPDKRRRSLLDKIAEFEAELAKKRFNLALAMGVVALIAATANDLAGTGDNLLKIVQSMSAVFGSEKAEEEDRQQLLPPREPFKALPDFSQKSKNVDWNAFGGDDEDIPF